MAKSKRMLWAALPLAALTGYLTCRSSGDDVGDAGDHVANQLWIGKLPKTDRELIRHVVLLDQDSGRFGVWGQSSTWRHDIEIFKWARERDRLLLYLPQTRKKTQAHVRSWRCEGEAPKPFQLCLAITTDGDERLYYSREDWVIEPGEVAESLEQIARDTPELDGYLDELDASPR